MPLDRRSRPRDWSCASALPLSGLPIDRAARADATARAAAPDALGTDRPGLRARERRRRSTATSPRTARRTASRSASASSSPAACSTRPGGRSANTLIEIWQANAAGRYVHHSRPARRAARSEFLRRRPLRHRRGRPLPLQDDQARRLSVAEPFQRLAAEPHPLLALRPDDRDAARHADVFSGRSAAGARPDLPVRAGGRARAARLGILARRDRARLRARLRLRHRASRPGRDADGDAAVSLKQTPSQTVGPFFAFGLTAPQYGYPYDAIASGDLADESAPGERIRIAGQVIDGAGEPIPDAMIEIWQADSEGRYAHPADGRAVQPEFSRLRPLRHRHRSAENRFVFRTIKPGSVDGDAGAAHQRHRLHARHAHARLHAPLFLRRGGRRTRAIRCCRAFRRSGATR